MQRNLTLFLTCPRKRIGLLSSSISPEDEADDSVLAQVNSTKRISTVQEAMAQRGLQVHGWVYNVANGLLKPLETGNDTAQKNYEIVETDESLE
jgi:carbonic anhydrase